MEPKDAKWLDAAAAAVAVLGLFALSAGVRADEAEIVPSDVAAYAEVLKQLPDIAEATTDTGAKDYPRIVVKTKAGYTFGLDFEGCTASGTNCYYLWFGTEWKTRKPVSLQVLNDWNGAGYSTFYRRSDGKTIQVLYLNLTGGVMRAGLESTIGSWVSEMESFNQQVAAAGK